VQHADQALYYGKAQGRNVVVIAEPREGPLSTRIVD